MARSGWARALALAVMMSALWANTAPAGTCVLPAWGAGPPMGNDVYGVATTSGGGLVYQGGGYSFSASGVVNTFRSYNPVTNTWTPLAPMPTAVSMASLLYDAVGGRLFLFGGTNPTTGVVYNLAQVYTIATNAWSAGPPMPDIRAFMGSGVIGTMMYLVGGYNTGNVDPAFNQTWEFNPVAGTYTPRATLPAMLGGPGSAVSGGRLYIMGGRNLASTNLGSNYEFDPVANAWATRANLLTAVNVPGSTALSGQAQCNGDVIVIGGGNPFQAEEIFPQGPDSMETTGVTQLYSVATNAWVAGPTLSAGRSFMGAAQAGDTLVALGGYNGSTTVATVDRIQGPPLPVALGGFSVE